MILVIGTLKKRNDGNKLVHIYKSYCAEKARGARRYEVPRYADDNDWVGAELGRRLDGTG